MGKMKFTKWQRAKVICFMRNTVEAYVDPNTGEVNTTLLAEDAINDFDFIEYPTSRKAQMLFDDCHEVWDLACEIADEHENE